MRFKSIEKSPTIAKYLFKRLMLVFLDIRYEIDYEMNNTALVKTR